MEINKLILNDDVIKNDIKLNNAHTQLQKLLEILSQKKLPNDIIVKINSEISEVNSSSLTGKKLLNFIKKRQSKIITLVEKELKIVPINYYRNLWAALGMSAFGLPAGVVLGLSLGNMVFLGIGLPIGLAIGMAVGTATDKKAKDEGRQLDIEIK